MIERVMYCRGGEEEKLFREGICGSFKEASLSEEKDDERKGIRC